MRKKSSVARNELAQLQLEEQAKQRAIAEKQLEVQSKLADRQIQQADRQMELQLQMCMMLKGINEKLNQK